MADILAAVNRMKMTNDNQDPSNPDGTPKSLIIVGDDRQMAPVIHLTNERGGYRALSVLDALKAVGVITQVNLTINYRSR